MPSTDAHSIDIKVDDGNAAYGTLQSINQFNGTAWETTGCVSGGDLTAAASAISIDLTNDSTDNCCVVYRLNQ